MPKRSDRAKKTSKSPDKSSGGQLDEKAQSQIGEKLRGLYEEVVEEPVPDHIVELLRRLEESASKKEESEGRSE